MGVEFRLRLRFQIFLRDRNRQTWDEHPLILDNNARNSHHHEVGNVRHYHSGVSTATRHNFEKPDDRDQRRASDNCQNLILFRFLDMAVRPFHLFINGGGVFLFSMRC
jgi:hypothetical protein